MPMMPFIGVRISWLMLARNSLLARLAASAASWACLKAVMSVRRLTTPPSLVTRSLIPIQRPASHCSPGRPGLRWAV